jgi:hypothetical protein
MKHLRFLALAALVALPLTACSDDDKDTVAPITGTISGTVTVEGAGQDGVTLSLIGPTTGSAVTSLAGTYEFTGVEAGSYAVLIEDSPTDDVIYATQSKNVTITTAGQVVTVDFAGSYIRTANISGNVIADGDGLAGVSVTITGPEGEDNDVTDGAGHYSVSGLRAGDYTVAIDPPAEYTFNDTSFDVSVGVGEAQEVSFFGELTETTDPVTASVVIKSVTNSLTGATINPNNVAGQIDVTLQIDPGENDLQGVCVLLDGAEVANGCQTLGSGAAEEMLQGGILEIVFTIFTNEYDEASGAPVYANKSYVLSARLDLENAQESNVTTSMNLKFNNMDQFTGSVMATASAIGSNGYRYYGGDLTVTVFPVIYSGKTIASVTVTFSKNGAPKTFTDTSSPFEMTIAKGTSSSPKDLWLYQTTAVAGDDVWVSGATFADGTVLTGLTHMLDGGSDMTIDNVAPPAVVWDLTDQVNETWPTCCSNNWVNPAYTFSSALPSSAFADNAGGVGGVVRTFHMGAATLSDSEVAALPGVETPGETGAGPSDTNTAFKLLAVLTDALGNKSSNALAGGGSNTLTTVGHDAAAPTSQAVTGDEDESIYNIAGGPAPAGLSFSAMEDRAGFSAKPVRLEIFRKAATTTNSKYLVYGNTAGSGGFVNTAASVPACAGVDPTPTAPCIPNGSLATMEAYYTTTGHMMDQAGNEVATEVVVKTLVDLVAPINQNINIPGTLVGGAMTTFTVPTVDFDLWSGAFGLAFPGPGGPYIPFGEEVMLGDGERWDGVLSPSATATITFPFVRGLEPATALGGAAAIVPAGYIGFISKDAAGNISTLQQNNFAAGTVPTPVSFTTGATVTFGVTSPSAAVNLCNGEGSANCATGDVKSVTLKTTATGPSGTYPNVFAGGTLYYYYSLDGGVTYTLLGTVGGSSGLISDTGAVRTYEWSFALTSAMVEMIPGGTNFPVYVIGVNSTGDALMSGANANVTVVDGK